MTDIAKQIVISMLENGYIEKTCETDKNIDNVNKAIDAIIKQLKKSKQETNITK